MVWDEQVELPFATSWRMFGYRVLEIRIGDLYRVDSGA
jgi:hypothetical protein